MDFRGIISSNIVDQLPDHVGPVRLEPLGRRAAPGPLRLRPAGTRAPVGSGLSRGCRSQDDPQAGCSRGPSDPPGGPLRLSRPGFHPFVPSLRWARLRGESAKVHRIGVPGYLVIWRAKAAAADSLTIRDLLASIDTAAATLFGVVGFVVGFYFKEALGP